MTTTRFSLCIFCLCLFASCGRGEQKADEPIRVKVAEAETLVPSSEREFSFISKPFKETELSFRVGGPIDRFEVYAGNFYHRGDIIAEIDSRDFRIRKERAEAVYNQAKAEFERIKVLYEKDNLSASAYEKARADYTSAKTAFETATNELDDTRLIAPFDGYVGEVYIEKFQDFIIPIERVDIEHHGSRSIGIVRDMDSALCKFPDKPCFNRSEKKPSGFRLFSCPRNMIENPFQFGCAEIRIDQKPGLFPDFLAVSLCLEAVAVFCGSPALPYDGMINRLSRILIPDNGGLSLIGDTDRCNILCRCLDLVHSLSGNRKLCGPDLTCIMLYPSRFRKMLDKLLLCHTADPSAFIKKNTAVTGRSGIQRHNIFCHIKILQYISWPRLNASAAS